MAPPAGTPMMTRMTLDWAKAAAQRGNDHGGRQERQPREMTQATILPLPRRSA